MNYFGLVFSFMIPGMIVGGMAATLICNYRKMRIEKKSHKRCLGERWQDLRVDR